MRFHYALVDDLIGEAEFEERVEAKVEACGGLVDEPTAAMLVVGDLGRAHRKVQDLFSGGSLVCFFGRVLAVSDPRAFVRADGEEGRIAGVSGLRGAYGFVHHHPWAKEVRVAVNFDCRGTRGVSYMYECSAPNRWLVRQLNHAETRAVATSSMAEIYYRMPVATDLTMFFDEGIPGLNFAFIDGLEYYHTALDNPDNLSQKSLQHHGQNALGMARRLGSVPLDGAGRGDSSVLLK